ncbi:MAG: hypothetical protein AAF789_07190 [Bacteroidota bacterium]
MTSEKPILRVYQKWYNQVVLVLVFSLLTADLIAQTEDLTMNTIESGMPLNNVNMIGKKVPKGQVIGDMYLLPDFDSGSIKFTNGSSFDNLEININIYESKVLFQREKSLRVAELGVINSIDFEDATYVTFSVEEEIFVGKQIYKAPDVHLVKSVEIILKEPTYKAGLDLGSRNYTYLRRHHYYLSLESGKFVKLRSSTKKNAKALGRNDVKAFVNDHKLNWSNENDLLELASFLDSSSK